MKEDIVKEIVFDIYEGLEIPLKAKAFIQHGNLIKITDTTLTNTTLSITWESLSGITSYQLEIGRAPNEVEDIYTVTGLTTSITIDLNQVYYISIRPIFNGLPGSKSRLIRVDT